MAPADSTRAGERLDADAVDRLRSALIRIARRVDRQVSGGGLSSSQLSVLAVVAMRGPIGLGELADIEGINPTMLSRIVGKLEEAGLIQRHVDPDDRRAARVEATAAGTRLRGRLLAERSRLLAEAIDRLPTEFADALVQALPALEALGDALPTGGASISVEAVTTSASGGANRT